MSINSEKLKNKTLTLEEAKKSLDLVCRILNSEKEYPVKFIAINQFKQLDLEEYIEELEKSKTD